MLCQTVRKASFYEHHLVEKTEISLVLTFDSTMQLLKGCFEGVHVSRTAMHVTDEAEYPAINSQKFIRKCNGGS